ncbi:hypothetical protein GF420_11380 [candidate division GN15 bacterium]|nr:hypothetical protein [candidate division GN15 bacterium]
MKTLLSVIALALLFTVGPSLSAQDGDLTQKTSLWIGGHYTTFSDYTKKVGEYKIGLDEFMPEFKVNYLGVGTDNIFRLDGHFYDRYNIDGVADVTIADQFSFNVQYRSLIHQLGQDRLEYMSTREYFHNTGSYGGKILTHEVLDPQADYNVHRQEILSEMSVLLSQKRNVRFYAAHRTILTDGHVQSIAGTHCFSCHVTSRTAEVQNNTHELEAGLQADINPDVTVGYEFDYRFFEPQAPDQVARFDVAKHPVHGGAGAEFSSRQVFDDTSVVVNRIPKSEKVGNKVRVKGNLGEKTRFATSLGYNRVENKYTEIYSGTWHGAVNLSTILSPRSRLVIKATGLRTKGTDDYRIDLPVYREGRPGPASSRPSFDYTRLSTLDRADARASAEFIHRLNPRMILAFLGGYERIDRYNYPADEDYVTSRLIGQGKLRYRQGLRFSGWARYRFEKTSDPFVAERGLFEARGREALGRDLTDMPAPWTFYYEREALHYQPITTSPTDAHEVELRGYFNPNPKVSLNLGLLFHYDKNGDLDSLDVKRTKFTPTLGLNLTPNPKWVLSTGYTMNHVTSRGPITVALFDG